MAVTKGTVREGTIRAVGGRDGSGVIAVWRRSSLSADGSLTGPKRLRGILAGFKIQPSLAHMILVRSIVASGTVALSALAYTAGAAASGVRAPMQPRTATAKDTGYRALDSTLALATFDSAWRTVGASLTGRGVTRIDWPAVSRELRPRAARAESDSALRAVVSDMLSRLGESHFAIMPPPSSSRAAGSAADATLGTAGLVVRLVDQRITVWRTDSVGPAQRAGVAPGWTVEQVDDVALPTLGVADTLPARRLAVLVGAMNALRGAPGSPVRIVGHDAAGVRRDVSFTREAIHGPTARFGNLPPLPASVELTRRTLADGRCIGVIRFEYWMPPVMPALDKSVDAVRGCAGVVLDLRGNLGGVAGMMMGAAGHFLNEPRTLGTMRTRGDEMRFVANPRRATDAGVPVEPFGGPVAIVVDGLSASTTEMFAAGLQSLGRARVFGERTAGQALPAMATKLPSGDVLMHVVADFVAADGSAIEGSGVVPDELVALTRADVVAGRDAPLEAAVRWIKRAGPSPR